MNTEMHFLREDAVRAEKYKHLTEGLPRIQRLICEQLMQNFDRVAAVSEDTTTGNIITFAKFAKPIISQVMPSLVANEIVSVQPIPLPTAKVFFKGYTYDTTQAPTTAGDPTYLANTLTESDGLSKRSMRFAGGTIVGEAVGTGDGVAVNFSVDLYPFVASSLVVKVNSVAASVSASDPAAGTFTLSAAPANGASITADYQLAMEGLGGAGTAKIPAISLKMDSTTIDAESYKLKMVYTIESMQDYRAYHGGDMDSELTRGMAEELRLEIDRLLIDLVNTNAQAGNVNWSKTIPAGYISKEWYETLIHAINDAANLIYRKRLVWANWVIMSPATFGFIDKSSSFRVGGQPSSGGTITLTLGSGPNVMGTLSARYKVIVDPLFPDDRILVGYRGASWEEAGAVYSPYVLAQTETFLDPNTFKSVKGLMQRAGKKIINPFYFGTVTLTA